MKSFFSALSKGKTGSSTPIQPTPPLGDLGAVWNVGQVSIGSLYWPMIFKSSENNWATTTTKKYFVIYSTDHDTGNGGIYWGEMDNPFFTGFVERGLIWEGNQTETPWVITVPSNETTLSDNVFLYYHTSQNTQMSRLLTSTGGVLHEANWTDRGAVYTIQSGDTHLGYTKVFKRGFQDYVALHFVASGGVRGVSYGTDPSELFTRQYTVDRFTATNMPADSSFSVIENLPFDYNGQKYCVALRFLNSGSHQIALWKSGNDFYPTEFIKDIYPALGDRMSAYREGNYIYCFHKEGDNINTDEPYHCYVFDIREHL